MGDVSQPSGVKTLAAGKWISGLKGKMRVPEAARRVLSVRLEVVRHFLAQSLKKPLKNPEHIHQLRVSTRRAQAALDIFADCLPKKIYRKTRRELKKFRQNAGVARDWDVFLEELQKETAQNPKPDLKPGLDFLLGFVVGQRLNAQELLERSVSGYSLVFDPLVNQVLDSLQQSKGEHSLGQVAARAIQAQLDQLEIAFARDLNDIENLHEVRIIGKKLRYAMEIFAGCFGSDFKKIHYSAVEEMQEILGRVNDSYEACRRIRFLQEKVELLVPQETKRYQLFLDLLLRFHEERMPRERLHFEEWWRQWQESGRKQALLTMLTRKEKVSY